MQQLDAVVVAVHPSGDTTLVVDLLCRELGRVTAVARSARRSRQRFPGGLDVLYRLEATLEPPRRGELHQLSNAHVTQAYAPLRRDPLALGRAAYVAELAAAVSPRGQVTAGVYDVVLAALDVLSAGEVGPALLRFVEVQLLLLLGEISPPSHCSSCGSALEGRALEHRGHPGHLFCARCAPPSSHAVAPAVAALLGALAGATAVSAAAAVVEPATSQQAGKFLHAVLDPLLPRPLRSRRFLAQLQRSS